MDKDNYRGQRVKGRRTVEPVKVDLFHQKFGREGKGWGVRGLQELFLSHMPLESSFPVVPR